MKKLFFFLVLGIILTSLTLKKPISKNSFSDNAIATWNGSSYTLNFSTTEFENWFNENTGLFEETYTFDSIKIDDPDPTDLDSIAYLEIKAHNDSNSIVLGINMVKDIVNDTTKLSFPDYEGENVESEPAGWKCTSYSGCNGCKKRKEHGHVVECPCTNNNAIACIIERNSTTSLPSWLSAIVALLTYLHLIW